jgi:hypothetical protein
VNPNWLVALYPRWWRDRYEEEFLEVLDQMPLTEAVMVDIVRGAIDAHLHRGELRAPTRRAASRWAVLMLVLVLLGADIVPGSARRSLGLHAS